MNQANKTNFWQYNKYNKALANSLRKEMTKAEACLWKYALKARQMKGYPFKRQRPVLNYIADFMCKELMLIIEVDGLTHQWGETVLKDNRKQEDLEKVGFSILRFTDEEVLTGINNVIYTIEDYVVNFERESTPLIPRQRGTI